MKLRVPLSDESHMSILSVYAPTLQSSQDTIISFYGILRGVITSILKEEKLLLMGDFNARVGRQRDIWNTRFLYKKQPVNLATYIIYI